MKKEYTILKNSVICLKCGTKIESEGEEFVSCPCGAVSIAGGTKYLWRRAENVVDFKEDSSVYDPSDPNFTHWEEVMNKRMAETGTRWTEEALRKKALRKEALKRNSGKSLKRK